MKQLLNKIPFEYVLLFFIIIEAWLLGSGADILFSGGIILAALLFAWRINPVKGLLSAAAILLCAVFFQIRQTKSDDSLKTVLGSRPVYGTFRIEVTDPLCCSLVDIYDGAVTSVKILNVTDNSNTTYQGSGNFLIFSKDLLPSDTLYGDVFEVKGSLRFNESDTIWNIDQNEIENDFRFGNFKKYMRSRNISGIISPDKDHKIVKLNSCDSIFRRILKARDNILAYSIRNIKVRKNKNLVAALFFGIKGALDPQSKENFIKSGTIHLFSVSGLHTGVLFGVIAIMLFFLPYKYRYLISALLLIPFLLTTGANIPALRAFLMIMLFSILKSCCLHIPVNRILALGCSFFLILNADNLTDAGFLYSFGITMILIQIGHSVRDWNRTWTSDLALTAVNRKNQIKPSFLRHHARKAIYAFCAALAAFAGGSIITLYFFGHLYPAAVWINYFILFYCTLLVAVFFINMLFAALPLIGPAIGSLLNGSLNFMEKVIDLGTEIPWQLNTGEISAAAAIIFYAALLLALCVRSKKVITVSLLILIMFFPLHILITKLQSPEILFIREPSDGSIGYVFANPRGNYAWCFNIRSTKSSGLAHKFLFSKGLGHVNLWIAVGSSRNTVNALTYTDKYMDIKKIIHVSPRKMRNTSAFPPGIFYENHLTYLSDWQIKEKTYTFFVKKYKTGFEYSDPWAIIPLYVFFDKKTNILKFSQGDKAKQLCLPDSNLTEYSIYEL